MTSASSTSRNGAFGSGRLAPVHKVTDERAWLYEIIQTIGSGPDLETILHGVVRLVTEATSCHACFVYLLDQDVLTLRAASAMYAHLEGSVKMAVGEGLTGWVASTRRPAFIKENALEDPRVRRAYFPELGDQHYQSLVSVPVFSRAGDVTGVITLHAEAPHEFSGDDLEFLEHTASLVAGAAENARLYEDARARIALLTELSQLAQDVAAAASSAELLQTVVEGCRRATRADRCEIYLLDAPDRLSMRAASPARDQSHMLDTRRLWVDSIRRSPSDRREAERMAALLWVEPAEGVPLFVPLIVGEEPLGVLALLTKERPRRDTESVLTAVASQTAVALKRHELIERLRETNRVKDLFEVLAHGRGAREELLTQAVALGLDLEAPHFAIQMVGWSPSARPAPGVIRRDKAGIKAPNWIERARRLQTSLGDRFPGSVFDQRKASIRGLLPLSSHPPDEAVTIVREEYENASRGQPSSLSVGLSDVCRDAASFRSGFEEATSAAEVGALVRGEPGVTAYEDLGPYRYVLSSKEGVRDRYQQHLQRLIEYDERRGTRLLETLETYLERRGNVVVTSKALFIHPNTLRQRLGRMQRIAGLDLEREDWLSLAIAMKVVKLRQMQGSTDHEEGKGEGL